MRRGLRFLLLGLWLAAPAAAQDAALLADRVEIVTEDTIVASGGVEVLYQDLRLRAPKLVYDSKAETLVIEGPIVLEQGADTVVLADTAELDAELQNGILRSARMVLDQQLQVAATEIQRVDGRYSQFYQTVASSCQVCAERPVPLWQIRARKVIHDEVERQLYFHDAQFRIGNLPVAYFPRLRMPDPTVDRYTGFLVPRIVNSGRIGAGIKVPYFVTLGDHADVTLTPFVTSKARTLEARYRQAFSFGDIVLNTAISTDELQSGLRGYVFGNGRFRLPRDYKLTFKIQKTSDSRYLLDYDYSNSDRLENNIEIARTRRNGHSEAGFTTFETLRGSELPVDDQLPNIQGYALHQGRFSPATLGGQGYWELGFEAHARESNIDVIGRDMARLGGQLGWSRSRVLGNGIVGRIGGRVDSDIYHIRHDSRFDDYLAQVTPSVEAELRWPFRRGLANGGAQVLEPVVHLAWSKRYGDEGPNESSTLVEFDGGNLFALSRFPGHDRYEEGLRAAAGLSWTHYAPPGWSWNIIAGRVYRAEDLDQFSNASGLEGRYSDWLLATGVRFSERLGVDARMIVAPDFTVAKAETRIAWSSDRLDLNGSYSRIVADPEENRPNLNSQIQLGGGYDISRHWLADFDLRYDVTAREATRAALGLTYRNECIDVDFSVSRRFTSSSNVVPTTNFGFSVGLNGFGSDGRRYRRGCSG